MCFFFSPDASAAARSPFSVGFSSLFFGFELFFPLFLTFGSSELSECVAASGSTGFLGLETCFFFLKESLRNKAPDLLRGFFEMLSFSSKEEEELDSGGLVSVCCFLEDLLRPNKRPLLFSRAGLFFLSGTPFPTSLAFVSSSEEEDDESVLFSCGTQRSIPCLGLVGVDAAVLALSACTSLG